MFTSTIRLNKSSPETGPGPLWKKGVGGRSSMPNPVLMLNHAACHVSVLYLGTLVEMRKFECALSGCFDLYMLRHDY